MGEKIYGLLPVRKWPGKEEEEEEEEKEEEEEEKRRRGVRQQAKEYGMRTKIGTQRMEGKLKTQQKQTHTVD